MKRIELVPYQEGMFWDFADAINEESCSDWHFEDPARVESLKEILANENAIMRGIIDADSGEFLGYCEVQNITKLEWELGITVLRAHHHEGIGYQGLRLFMDELVQAHGKRAFVAKIAPDNLASIRLFQKLGATPKRIERGLWMLDDEMVARFEEEHPELINETVCEMADLFGVEPTKLLGRLLVFDVPYEQEGRKNGF